MWSVRATRRLALAVLAAGSAAALVSVASLALFRSSAQPQTDTFTSGTVNLGTAAPTDACAIRAVVPGESGTCQYTVEYRGSVPAWVGLDVQESSVAAVTYTPPGGATATGGSVLLGGRSGLAITLADRWGNALTAPTCLPAATTPASCGAALDDELLRDAATAAAGAPAGAWTNGTRDTVTVDWSLPLGTSDAVQGASARITLTAHAVQAADNPLVGGAPREGWQTTPAPAQLRASPLSIRFGSVVAGQLSAAQPIAWTNDGGVPTTPVQLTLAGANHGDYRVSRDGCGGRILGPGASCTATVLFAPTATGTLTATVGADSGPSAADVQLLGVGAPDPPPSPDLQLRPTAKALGSGTRPVLVGGPPAHDSVTLTDSGAPARMAVTVSGAGWSLGGNACAPDLAAGQDCTLTVVFAPRSAGMTGGLPSYGPTTATGVLAVAAGTGTVARLALSGTAAWGCTAFAADGYSGCRLAGASFADETVSGANLSGATLTRTDFSDTIAVGTNLSHANLTNADLTGADLAGTDLAGATLTGARTTAITWNGATCPDGTAADADGGSCLNHLEP